MSSFKIPFNRKRNHKHLILKIAECLVLYILVIMLIVTFVLLQD